MAVKVLVSRHRLIRGIHRQFPIVPITKFYSCSVVSQLFATDKLRYWLSSKAVEVS